MAANMFRKYTENQTREILVATGTLAGVPVLEPVSLRPAFTLTAAGDATGSRTLADGTTQSGIPIGGIGNQDLGAVVAFDGTFLYAVTGVTAGETIPGGAGTDKGTAVYAVVSSGVITSLTLTSSGNTLFGRIDDGRIVGTTSPVQIGVI